MVFCGVDSYLPRFTSSHGQNIVDSRGAAKWVNNKFWPCDDGQPALGHLKMLLMAWKLKNFIIHGCIHPQARFWNNCLGVLLFYKGRFQWNFTFGIWNLTEKCQNNELRLSHCLFTDVVKPDQRGIWPWFLFAQPGIWPKIWGKGYSQLELTDIHIKSNIMTWQLVMTWWQWWISFVIPRSEWRGEVSGEAWRLAHIARSWTVPHPWHQCCTRHTGTHPHSPPDYNWWHHHLLSSASWQPPACKQRPKVRKKKATS